jgi:hypothetical protein
MTHILLEENTIFGIVDEYLFRKSKTDKYGNYTNSSIILRSFSSLKELIEKYELDRNVFSDKLTISYRKANDGFHFVLINELSINSNTIEKYKLLVG